jgi:hypothetical protein
MLLVAKSWLAVWDRATPVTTDVGSKLARPATLPIAPPERAPSRPAARMARTASNRSSTVIGPAGTWTRRGAKALESAPPLVLVLTTKLMFRASSGVSRSSWKRTAPITAPATKTSLMLPPRALDAALTASSGTRITSKWRCRLRCRHRGEPPATVPGLTWLRMSPTVATARAAASSGRRGSAPHRMTSPASRRAWPS